MQKHKKYIINKILSPSGHNCQANALITDEKQIIYEANYNLLTPLTV